MIEKTITQLALNAGVETGGTENALAILKFAKSYADQEKRSTAIAYNKWVELNAYWLPSKERWYLYKAEDESWIPGGRTDEELYEYYLSLDKTV